MVESLADRYAPLFEACGKTVWRSPVHLYLESNIVAVWGKKMSGFGGVPAGIQNACRSLLII